MMTTNRAQLNGEERRERGVVSDGETAVGSGFLEELSLQVRLLVDCAHLTEVV